jgi:uncharacterized protein (DUF58 family)
VRATGPVIGSALALGGWAAVAHNSGSGWVQALGALLAGFLVVGLGAPVLAVRRARCDVRESPLDAAAGSSVELSLSASTPVRVRPTDPTGAAVVVGTGAPGVLQIVPDRRGELGSITVKIASAAPFGLLWWEKDAILTLPRPLLVAPRLGEPDRTVLDAVRRRDGEDRRLPDLAGEPRGIRDYRPGDLRHLVHWPATAHTGTLMVRDMESPRQPPVALRAELPTDPAAAERTAERIFGTIGGLLASGRQVDLVTLEITGERTALVASMLDAGRRLARAVSPGAAVPLVESLGIASDRTTR